MQISTKAAVLFNINKPLKILDINLPPPAFGEVLIKIHFSGICHTQLLEIAGKNATGSHVPNLMGHEASGEVIKVGQKVKKVKKGDFVVLSWIKGKGLNVIPKPIKYKKLQINRGGVTTFSKYTVVSENRVFPIKNKIPSNVASLLGCAVPTGMGMIFNNAKVKKNSNVIVLGCGGVGINAIHAAKISKAKKIIAVDVKQEKMESALKFGATHFLNFKDKQLKNKILKILNNDEMHFSIDTVGKKNTMEFAYNISSKFNGHVILCGVPNPLSLKICIDPFPLYYGRSLTGTGGGETIPDKDLNKYAKLYVKKIIKLDEMITHVVSLNEINKGIELMKKGQCTRVLVDMNL